MGKSSHSNVRLLNMYNKGARGFGEAYLRKHYWRIKAMYDAEDIVQDAFAVYIRVYRRHARKGRKWSTEADLLRVYKRAIWGRVNNRSRQCFPNPHALVADVGSVVVQMEDLEGQLSSDNRLDKCLEKSYDISVMDLHPDEGIDLLKDTISGLPKELAEALVLLVRDFLGVSCIERKKRRRLSGPPRIEPKHKALARKMNVDPSRNLIAELSRSLGFQIQDHK